MKSNEKEKINIDFTGSTFSDVVKNFRPDIYFDGEQYLCTLGAGDEAVVGKGRTIEDAFSEWEKNYRK